MGRKGLNREHIVKTAIKIIEERGVMNFSLHLLADELGVKTASLYNHIANINDLFYDAGIYALKTLENCLRDAVSSKERDEALRSLAYAYLDFAHEKRELYDFIMYIRTQNHVGIDDFVTSANIPIVEVLSSYDIDKTDLVHRHRLLRSILHGFITQERSGFFKHSPESIQKSYEVAINCFLNDIHNAENNREE